MSSLLQCGLPVRRHSLLRRNPEHDLAGFSAYYENSHGPFASSKAGFRKYTTQYIQNHVLPLPDGIEAPFDGVTMTTQVKRADYATGFFTEPDYQSVKPDELFLFDMTKTISILGVEEILVDGQKSAFKALLITHVAELDIGAWSDVARAVLNRLDVSTASALGFGAGTFAYDALVEFWFESEAARLAAYIKAPAVAIGGATAMLLPVREVLIYGPEKPWKSA